MCFLSFAFQKTVGKNLQPHLAPYIYIYMYICIYVYEMYVYIYNIIVIIILLSGILSLLTQAIIDAYAIFTVLL